MGDRAFANKGDDFHIAMRMGGETAFWRNLVIIPDTDIAPAHALRIMILCETEMMPGIEPAMICMAQG
jgi:hypothetical protein